MKYNSLKYVYPVIYGYTAEIGPKYVKKIKVGFTDVKDGNIEARVKKRIEEQRETTRWDYTIQFIIPAFYDDGEMFGQKRGSKPDIPVHEFLEACGLAKDKGAEWFYMGDKFNPKDVEKLIYQFKSRKSSANVKNVNLQEFIPRKEQLNAIVQTKEIFESHSHDSVLWNAKMRFGKTPTTYELIREMSFEKVLVLTNRPAVFNSWIEDGEKFVRGKMGHFFVSDNKDCQGINKGLVKSYDETIHCNDFSGKIIAFESLQGLKGSKYSGTGCYDKLSWIYDVKWDLIVFDECHEGVYTDKAEVALDGIKVKNKLYLSGTPFKAMANGMFSDDVIFNWTYADEQNAKLNWEKEGKNKDENPYAEMPKMNMMTFRMSQLIKDKASKGVSVNDETLPPAFTLNDLFKTNSKGEFVYCKQVKNFIKNLYDDDCHNFPFSTNELIDEFKHTFWLLSRVDSAKALAKILEKDVFFKIQSHCRGRRWKSIR